MEISKILGKLYQKLLSKKTKEKSEKAILWIALASFIIHLLIIGLIQSVAMIPGVSRSAASIFGGMALKLDRQSAVEFSFFLAIPTMTVATLFDVIKFSGSISQSQLLSLAVGMMVAFVTALLVIKYLLIYIQKNNFMVFGVYRIVLSVVYYFLFLR